MTKRTGSQHGEKDTDSDTDRSLFARIVEGVIVFFISALLLKLGIEFLLSIRVPLLITAAIIAIAVMVRTSTAFTAGTTSRTPQR